MPARSSPAYPRLRAGGKAQLRSCTPSRPYLVLLLDLLLELLDLVVHDLELALHLSNLVLRLDQVLRVEVPVRPHRFVQGLW